MYINVNTLTSKFNPCAKIVRVSHVDDGSVLIYRDLCSRAGLSDGTVPLCLLWLCRKRLEGLDVFDRGAVLAKKPSNPLLVYLNRSAG